MNDFATLGQENPAFDDLLEARDAIVRAIDMRQLSEEALQENLLVWDQKVLKMHTDLILKH